MPVVKYFDDPGIEVEYDATRPPVYDSAVDID